MTRFKKSILVGLIASAGLICSIGAGQISAGKNISSFEESNGAKASLCCQGKELSSFEILMDVLNLPPIDQWSFDPKDIEVDLPGAWHRLCYHTGLSNDPPPVAGCPPNLKKLLASIEAYGCPPPM